MRAQKREWQRERARGQREREEGEGRVCRVIQRRGEELYLAQGKATREAEEEDEGCCCVWQCCFGWVCCCGEIGLPWGYCCVRLEGEDGSPGLRESPEMEGDGCCDKSGGGGWREMWCSARGGME